MRVDFYSIKADYFSFIRANAFRFVLGGLILLVFAGLGIAGAFLPEVAADAFAASNQIVIVFLRRDTGIFSCFIAALLEFTVLYLLCVLSTLTCPTVYLCYGAVAYKSYFGFRCLFTVIRHLKIRSVLFTVFYAAHLLFCLTVLLSLSVQLIDRQQCYARGLFGLKTALVQTVPAVIAASALVFLILILLPIARIFM